MCRGNWFAKNGPEIMVIVAIVFSGLIAGEVEQRDYLLLLGKPIAASECC